MPTTRLSRSIPFWVLVGGSVVATAGGAYLLTTKLASMTTTLTDGSATTADVYVGQIWAVAGAIFLGAGLIGLALALTLGAVRSLVAPAVEVVEVIDAPEWEDDAVLTNAPAPVADTTTDAAETGVLADEPAPVAVTDADVETSSTEPEPHTR